MLMHFGAQQMHLLKVNFLRPRKYRSAPRGRSIIMHKPLLICTSRGSQGNPPRVCVSAVGIHTVSVNSTLSRKQLLLAFIENLLPAHDLNFNKRKFY